MTEKNFVRVNKTVARRLYNEGETVYFHPCLVSPYSAWMTPTPYIHVSDKMEFDNLVNAYEHYNCDAERGRYCAFYIPI